MIHPRAMKVLKFICDFKTARDGNSPTFREIADGCAISSTSLVNFYLCKLEAAGLVTVWRNHRARMIYVTGGNWTSPKGLA